jgi:hypothetical protein
MRRAACRQGQPATSPRPRRSGCGLCTPGRPSRPIKAIRGGDQGGVQQVRAGGPNSSNANDRPKGGRERCQNTALLTEVTGPASAQSAATAADVLARADRGARPARRGRRNTTERKRVVLSRRRVGTTPPPPPGGASVVDDGSEQRSVQRLAANAPHRDAAHGVERTASPMCGPGFFSLRLVVGHFGSSGRPIRQARSRGVMRAT